MNTEQAFEQAFSYENLFAAYRRARRGKGGREEVAQFGWNLESNLLALRDEILGGTYVHGRYRKFIVSDSKRREIQAAPFRDRVAHQAIVAAITPLFESRFIFDSYACRCGKGTHAAVARFERFARASRYALMMDISKYFASIDHSILLRLLARRVRDERMMRLCGIVVASCEETQGTPPPLSSLRSHFAVVETVKREAGVNLSLPFGEESHTKLSDDGCGGKGIPIGNLTSQLFANVYLDELDQYVKHSLRARRYVRYMDDFAILHDDKAHLHALKADVTDFLAARLRLTVHPQKAQIEPTRCGVGFLGFRVFPHHRLLRPSTVRRFVVRVKRAKRAGGGASEESLRSWLSWARDGNSHGLVRSLAKRLSDPCLAEFV